MPTEPRTYPPILEMTPLQRVPRCVATVPGSKSITNRAVVLAALNGRVTPCTIFGALQSEDTEVMIDSLLRLGFAVTANWRDTELQVGQNYSGRVIPAESADLYVANSGTTMRFLTAAVSVGNGHYRLAGVPRMHERPIADLLDALTALGVRARSESGNGCPPVVVESTGKFASGRVKVAGAVSSQFLSALMLAAPFSDSDETALLFHADIVSRPYLHMTERMLRDWGLAISAREGEYRIPGRQRSTRSEYVVEPDASAASYFFAAAAITGGTVTVPGLSHQSLQGDVAFARVLEQMGCRVEECDSGITVHGRELHGVDVDMNAISDTVMTLAVVACFATGATTIRNVSHIRHKETDRIAALACELRKVGMIVDEFPDGLRIEPRAIRPASMATYNDHRMAMSFALLGLKSPGIKIENPGCVAKTYPGFWDDLARFAG